MDNDIDRNGTFFRFEDLRVYHKALDYIDWVYNATRLFPEDNTANLTRRFIQSAQAIAFYIAEGSARNKPQFVHYLKMAKSAVRECVVLTTMAEKQSLLTEQMISESRNELMEMTKMLGALIGSLQRAARAKGKGKYNESDPDTDNDYSYSVENDQEEEFTPSDSFSLK